MQRNRNVIVAGQSAAVQSAGGPRATGGNFTPFAVFFANVVDSNVNGYDGPYPAVTTIGLRNLAGVVHEDGTVTLWAVTSTSSASGDNGADPNKVVRITDRISATTMTGEVSRETFATIAGPTYGTAYRGVAYVCGAIDPRTGVCRTGGFGF